MPSWPTRCTSCDVTFPSSEMCMSHVCLQAISTVKPADPTNPSDEELRDAFWEQYEKPTPLANGNTVTDLVPALRAVANLAAGRVSAPSTPPTRDELISAALTACESGDAIWVHDAEAIADAVLALLMGGGRGD